jgi:hypothetical protein
LSVLVDSGNSKSKFVVICSVFTYDDNCILEDHDLVILLNASIIRINLLAMRIERHCHLSDFGTYFSIYEFEKGYVVYGELDIVRVAKDFTVLWRFGGADIFVTPDGKESFAIEGTTLVLRDWNGRRYTLNEHGVEIPG